MSYWLVKSEPGEWSWGQHVNAGTSSWTGVRNHQAQKNLRAMQTGDLAFFYHTGGERQIVGIVKVSKAAYPDPTDKTGKSVAVEFKAMSSLNQPVALSAIKADPTLSHLALVKQSRLSVMPIDPVAWKRLCGLGGIGLSGSKGR